MEHQLTKTTNIDIGFQTIIDTFHLNLFIINFALGETDKNYFLSLLH